MKVRADEHVSPKIVRSIQSLILSPGWELTHVREHNAPRTAEETWVPRFVAEGGQGILSADRKMMARPHQIVALIESGVIAIFLSAAWSQAKRHEQASQLLWWWPRIESVFASSKPRQYWRVPYDFSDSAQIEEINVNYFQKRSASAKE